MIDCIPDPTDSFCINCGWRWKRDTPFPHRNCTNPPDLRPAMNKLEWTGAIPPGMAPRLAKWVAEGMPERSGDPLGDLAKIKCDHRPGGVLCRKVGCPHSKIHVACVWLYRMATEDCPADHF